MNKLIFRKIKGKGPEEIAVELDRIPMEMEDPVLAAGSAHTATATFPVTPSGLACTAELFLSLDGTTKIATSGPIAFTSTGTAQTVSLSVTIPSSSSGQSYRVLLDIVSGGVTLAAYEATDHVIIPVVGTPTITWS